jgi:hypothetical protein
MRRISEYFCEVKFKHSKLKDSSTGYHLKPNVAYDIQAYRDTSSN